jgi:nitroimidazol reductase NimA-like FMN-containing flavoprotein (pyridoxamine 5'-phosphate oxidase superfamily)
MNLWERVYDFVEKQTLAVLGTSFENKSYTTLVAFTVNMSGGEVFFVISISSRKAKNLNETPFVSL